MNSGLNHLDGTLSDLDDLAKRLIGLLQPIDAIVERIDDIAKAGETLTSPLLAAEHAVRGVLDRLRNRTVH